MVVVLNGNTDRDGGCSHSGRHNWDRHGSLRLGLPGTADNRKNLTRAALTALSAFCRKASKLAASSLRFNFRHCPFALGLFGCRRKRQNGVFDGHI